MQKPLTLRIMAGLKRLKLPRLWYRVGIFLFTYFFKFGLSMAKLDFSTFSTELGISNGSVVNFCVEGT